MSLKCTLHASGNGAIGIQETTLWTGTAMWTSQIARRTNVSLSARHQRQSGASTYNESALLATLNMTF